MASPLLQPNMSSESPGPHLHISFWPAAGHHHLQAEEAEEHCSWHQDLRSIFPFPVSKHRQHEFGSLLWWHMLSGQLSAILLTSLSSPSRLSHRTARVGPIIGSGRQIIPGPLAHLTVRHRPLALLPLPHTGWPLGHRHKQPGHRRRQHHHLPRATLVPTSCPHLFSPASCSLCPSPCPFCHPSSFS